MSDLEFKIVRSGLVNNIFKYKVIGPDGIVITDALMESPKAPGSTESDILRNFEYNFNNKIYTLSIQLGQTPYPPPPNTNLTERVLIDDDYSDFYDIDTLTISFNPEKEIIRNVSVKFGKALHLSRVRSICVNIDNLQAPPVYYFELMHDELQPISASTVMFNLIGLGLDFKEVYPVIVRRADTPLSEEENKMKIGQFKMDVKSVN